MKIACLFCFLIGFAVLPSGAMPDAQDAVVRPETDVPSLVAVARGQAAFSDRAHAIALLGESKSPEAETALLDLLDSDSDQDIQRAAGFALARMGNERGLKMLRKFMEEAKDLRQKAILASILVEAGDAAAYPVFDELTRATDPELRALVAQFAGKLGVEKAGSGYDATTVLLRLSQDKDASVRSAALYSFIETIRRGSPREPLQQAAQKIFETDPAPEVREAARLALSSIIYWVHCSEKPLSLGCPEGNKKIIADCRRNPNGEGCDQIKDLLKQNR